MRIAIVGAGIAGLTAAYRLSRDHDVTVYEANDYAGGHTHTVDVNDAGLPLAVDTGFIVFNDRTYPNFIALLAKLGVESQPSNMSFSLQCESSGLEYNGTSLNALFAQRRNVVSPTFLRMLVDILRFNARAQRLLVTLDSRITLREYLEQHGYSRAFRARYIVPLGKAIWSAGEQALLGFPARFFIEFFDRHGFLSIDNRPQWRSIKGGSREYVRKFIAHFGRRLRLRTPIAGIHRHAHQVSVRTARGEVDHFDHVFLACHGDQALRLLADPSPTERTVLGALTYQANEAILHTDDTLLPRRPLARAAWNYHLLAEEQEAVAVTYYMNVLQSLPTPRPYLVTLNRARAIEPAKIIRRIQYHHPVYSPAAVAAQNRRLEINGTRRTYYCGAYWSSGFHEDGVKSALWALDDFRRTVDSSAPQLARAG